MKTDVFYKLIYVVDIRLSRFRCTLLFIGIVRTLQITHEYNVSTEIYEGIRGILLKKLVDPELRLRC
jgi:hypothetical protein